MRVGAFQIKDFLPSLNEPHALVVLRPWVDVGSVGSEAVGLLEKHLHAKLLGQLVKPGNFFDFTRYRPMIHRVAGQREVDIPNSFINYATRRDGGGLLFFHLLEPQMHGEVYTDSVLEVLRKLGVSRYCLIGGMYDAVPHTKPLIVSGSASGTLGGELRRRGVQSSDYEGPTTIMVLVSQQAPKYNIEVMSLIVHLPQYARVEKDYAGILCLVELLCSLYHIPIELEGLRREAEKQNMEMNLAMEKEPHLKQVIKQLERYYEARANPLEERKLSPEIENFLRQVTRRFEED